MCKKLFPTFSVKYYTRQYIIVVPCHLVDLVSNCSNLVKSRVYTPSPAGFHLLLATRMGYIEDKKITILKINK